MSLQVVLQDRPTRSGEAAHVAWQPSGNIPCAGISRLVLLIGNWTLNEENPVSKPLVAVVQLGQFPSSQDTAFCHAKYPWQVPNEDCLI